MRTTSRSGNRASVCTSAHRRRERRRGSRPVRLIRVGQLPGRLFLPAFVANVLGTRSIVDQRDLARREVPGRKAPELQACERGRWDTDPCRRRRPWIGASAEPATATDVEAPIWPELVLVNPELARRARALLPDRRPFTTPPQVEPAG